VCGITGWVDFEGNLTRARERQIVEQMTSRLSNRGPDASGTWFKPHVALGHRRLAVIDIEGGRQPMEFDVDGRSVAAISYSGETYNYLELRHELESCGHYFRTNSDTEVVLHAYLQWGDDFVNRLIGMYAFAIWDESSQELVLVRDRLGVKPLFYHPLSCGAVFASEPKSLLCHPDVNPTIDLNGFRQMFLLAKTPGRSIYSTIEEVRPGELIRIGRGTIRRRLYWRLRVTSDPVDTATATQRVRELFEEVVRHQGVADVRTCTLLSGGLDSSVLTALVALDDRARGSQVHSYSVDFVKYADEFRPDPLRSTPDGPFAAEVARHVGSVHRNVTITTDHLLNRANRDAAMVARDAPCLGNMDTSLYLLFRAIKEEATVALSGEAADEVFGGYRWFHDPVAVSAPTFPWIASGRELYPPGLALDPQLLNPSIYRKLELDACAEGEYIAAIAEVEHEQETSVTTRMRELTYLHLTRFVQLLLDRKDRMSMATGLEVRVPYCDHRLVELAYATPWPSKVFDGREKSILRSAFGFLLPQSVADRPKSPYPATQDRSYFDALFAELRRLMVTGGNDEFRSLVDLQAIETAITERAAGRTSNIRDSALESAVELARWIEQYKPILKVA
jgi:asparagine synthase (glutamine-hydrolysing)